MIIPNLIATGCDQCAVAGFPKAVHLLHHVGELRDVELGDPCDFANLFRFVVVMGVRVVLVVEAQFRIGGPVWCRANVGAYPGEQAIERVPRINLGRNRLLWCAKSLTRETDGCRVVLWKSAFTFPTTSPPA